MACHSRRSSPGHLAGARTSTTIAGVGRSSGTDGLAKSLAA
jgi:hypothetical protein